jgi:VanZ family protein
LLDTNKKIPVLPVAVFLVVIAGGFDEFHQAFVPERNVDGWDLLADFCGGLFAAFVTHRFMNKGHSNHVST